MPIAPGATHASPFWREPRAKAAAAPRAGPAAGGESRATGNSIRPSPRRWRRVSGGKADLEFCRVLRAKCRPTFDFLDRHAVPWIYFDQPFANRNTGGGLGMPVPGGVASWTRSPKSIDDLPNAAIHYETEAIRAQHRCSGRVTGVHVRGPEGTKHLDGTRGGDRLRRIRRRARYASRASGPARRSRCH